MSEMVERIARAIAEAKIRAHGGKPFDPYVDLARAAIAAMREPTIEMEDAARERDPLDGNAIAEDHWRAMIDEALKD